MIKTKHYFKKILCLTLVLLLGVTAALSILLIAPTTADTAADNNQLVDWTNSDDLNENYTNRKIQDYAAGNCYVC